MSESDTKPAAAAAAEPSVPPDPIYQKSYSVHIAVASVALVGSVALAIADDLWLRRPYKGVQMQFAETYSAYLDHLIAERTDADAVIAGLDEIQAANKELAAAVAGSRAAVAPLEIEFADVGADVTALTEALKVAKSEIAALTYEAEHHAHAAGDADAASSAAAKATLDEIERIRRRTVKWLMVRGAKSPEAGKNGEEVSGTVAKLSEDFLALQKRKAELQREIGRLSRPASEAKKRVETLVAAQREGIAAVLQLHPEENDPVRLRIAERIVASGASAYLDAFHTTLPVDLLRARKTKVDAMPTSPLLAALFGGELQTYQIHSKEGNDWVDRCQVCHLGALEPIPITSDGLRAKLTAERTTRDPVMENGVPAKNPDGSVRYHEETRTIPAWSAEKLDAMPLSLFESHPRAKELFEHHDPERVACSMCHSGNGVAITSVKDAHGNNKDWLWPAYRKENSEAGCIQCHQGDIHLDAGPRISAARESFLDKGCWGCHRYGGHDPEPDEIMRLEGRMADIDAEIARIEVRRKSLQDLMQPLSDDQMSAVSPASERDRDALQERKSNLLTERGSLSRRAANAARERIRVGPNLKNVRAKIRPEYLAWWIQDPEALRPGTKMPVFRLAGPKDADGLHEEAKDLAAFIWQKGLDPATYPEFRLSAPSGGSIARGKQLFDQVGCLACHSSGQGADRVGADFAANLTNLGDKATYEFVFRWIKDPRHRIVPWSKTKNRDLTREEWEKEDPASLVWIEPTRMGDFRLSDDDARDIATYLTSQRSGTTYPEADYLMDGARAERGAALASYLGCAGCHEIQGLEHEKGIGRELTAEGSQPLDRLDYGHETTNAQRGHEPLADWTTADGVKPFTEGEPWYRPRGFFMHKLASPGLFDTSKYLPDRFLRLRMPQFQWKAQELTDMTTFLLGSLEPQIPSPLRYQPDEKGLAIREGWWVIKKFNCQGCHTFRPGDVPGFANLPWIAEATREAAGRDRNLPPTLVGEGLRVRAEWLAKFLHDPSLGGGTANPRSVRRHLDVRMPTFHFSDDDVARLVRFFQAMADQPFATPDEPFVALSDAERATAEKIWQAGTCIQCHLADGVKDEIDGETKAPNLTYADERLRPDWMRRWVQGPSKMQPRTSMLDAFRFDEPTRRWVFAATTDELAKEHAGDHIALIVRYIRSLRSGAPR